MNWRILIPPNYTKKTDSLVFVVYVCVIFTWSGRSLSMHLAIYNISSDRFHCLFVRLYSCVLHSHNSQSRGLLWYFCLLFAEQTRLSYEFWTGLCSPHHHGRRSSNFIGFILLLPISQFSHLGFPSVTSPVSSRPKFPIIHRLGFPYFIPSFNPRFSFHPLHFFSTYISLIRNRS